MGHSIPREPGAPQRGFTLVEVMVALIIFTVGVLGLAATTSFLVRQTTLSETTTERAAAVQQVVERLKAANWDDLASGSDAVGPFSVSWTVVRGNRSKMVTIETVGPGLSSATGQPTLADNVAKTFQYRIVQP